MKKVLTFLLIAIAIISANAQLPEGSFLSDQVLPQTWERVSGQSQFILGEALSPDAERRAYVTHVRSTNPSDNAIYTAYVTGTALPYDPGSNHYRMTIMNVDISFGTQYLAYGYMVRFPKYLGTYTKAGKTSHVYTWVHELILSSTPTACNNCKATRGAATQGRTSMY